MDELKGKRFPPNNIEEVVNEARIWGKYNFGSNVPPYQPLLGAVEELGELAHAQLKGEQGIRDSTTDKKIDAVGDIVIYLIDYCNRSGLSFVKCVLTAWKEVRQRDWKRFPKNGRSE